LTFLLLSADNTRRPHLPFFPPTPFHRFICGAFLQKFFSRICPLLFFPTVPSVLRGACAYACWVFFFFPSSVIPSLVLFFKRIGVEVPLSEAQRLVQSHPTPPFLSWPLVTFLFASFWRPHFPPLSSISCLPFKSPPLPMNVSELQKPIHRLRVVSPWLTPCSRYLPFGRLWIKLSSLVILKVFFLACFSF